MMLSVFLRLHPPPPHRPGSSHLGAPPRRPPGRTATGTPSGPTPPSRCPLRRRSGRHGRRHQLSLLRGRVQHRHPRSGPPDRRPIGCAAISSPPSCETLDYCSASALASPPPEMAALAADHGHMSYILPAALAAAATAAARAAAAAEKHADTTGHGTGAADAAAPRAPSTWPWSGSGRSWSTASGWRGRILCGGRGRGRGRDIAS